MLNLPLLVKTASLVALSLPVVASATFAAEEGLAVLDYAAYKSELVSDGSFEYFNYTNVRYAAPPVGSNRFRAPVRPANNYNNGVLTAVSEGHNCIQLLEGDNYVPNQDEDCLFLDVLAPRAATKENLLPVVVYLYGGEFAEGFKALYPGDGFLRASGNQVLYVVPNFRSGVFGFLPGSAVQQDGDLNAGLLDQAFALQWVKRYIVHFGGDAEKITVIGSGSGAAAVLHHLTANGGEGEQSITQAVVQSSAYVPLLPKDAEELYNGILALSKTKSLHELRGLSTAVLSAVTQEIQRTKRWRPSIDGKYVTDLPTRLLKQGKFRNVPLLITRARDEGQTLMPRTFPFIPVDSDAKHDSPEIFSAFLQSQGIYLTPAAAKQAAVYYPPINQVDPKMYNTIFGRYTVLLTEAAYACYGRALNQATKGKAWNLLFNVGQGFNGDDTSYLFNGSKENLEAPLRPIANTNIAKDWQGYVTNFATTGNPNTGAAGGLPELSSYGTSSSVLNMGDDTTAYGSKKVETIQDPLAIEAYAIKRCKFWQDEAWL